jgi:transposase
MAMGKREDQQKQDPLWIAHTELATAPGHPFYQKLNELLDAERFDGFVEALSGKFYADKFGRPSLLPSVYFRSLLIGYFEGIEGECGIAWRIAYSLALRRFLGIALTERTPDHSTLSRTRRLIDLETHEQVFAWVRGLLADRGLLEGKRIGIDATTLEANAAMRSIVRRDTGESYNEFLTGLAKASGIETPTREDLARIDRKRKKRTSNKEWKSPVDEDACVAKMKDGRTHLAHMAEAELVEREAELHPEAEPKVNLDGIEELVADKGYYSGAVVKWVGENEVISYIPERKQAGKRNWDGKQAEQQAVEANHGRVTGDYGKQLLRRRGEFIERSFAHCYETGGMRRSTLRGHDNILKRLLIHVCAFNISLILRKMLGAGTPRELKNRAARLVLRLFERLTYNDRPVGAVKSSNAPILALSSPSRSIRPGFRLTWNSATCTTGC